MEAQNTEKFNADGPKLLHKEGEKRILQPI